MRPSLAKRASVENDAVGLVIALLVRYPQIATIVSHPATGTLTLSFAVRGRVDRAAAAELRDVVLDHVRSLLDVLRDAPETLSLAVESDQATSFVRIARDARSFGRDELALLVALLAARYGDRLVQSPADDDAFEDDASADDLVECALDALRDVDQQRGLVGFREEKRVLVYFVPTRKKTKARARS